MKNNNTYILAIDTSCDDTSASVTCGVNVLSNVIASQTQLHKEYGGVFPTVAKQAHKEHIDAVVAVALKRARVLATDIQAVAVTQGPGLAPALEVGIIKAKQLSEELDIPLIAVNHIEGHALSPLVQPRTKLTELPIHFPILSLVISGGNSLFILIKNFGEYEVLGSTIDDAAGECLDKIGRILGLGYPAGPVLEQFAKYGNPYAFEFPLPLTHVKDFNVSFSGLKTFARNLVAKLESEKPLTQQQTYDLCASAQYGIFRHICYKLEKILQKYEVSEVWLGGGVAANVTLRKMLRKTLKKNDRTLNLRVPYTKKLCMDNAAMIGVVAGFKFERGEVVTNVNEVQRKPRWAVNEI